MTEKQSYTKEDLKFIDDCVGYLQGEHIFAPKYGYILSIKHDNLKITKDYFFKLTDEEFDFLRQQFEILEQVCENTINMEKTFFSNFKKE